MPNRTIPRRGFSLSSRWRFDWALVAVVVSTGIATGERPYCLAGPARPLASADAVLPRDGHDAVVARVQPAAPDQRARTLRWVPADTNIEPVVAPEERSGSWSIDIPAGPGDWRVDLFRGTATVWRASRVVGQVAFDEPLPPGRPSVAGVDLEVRPLAAAVARPERRVMLERPEGELWLHVIRPLDRSGAEGAEGAEVAERAEPRPAVLLFFGGGWHGGRPAQLYDYARWFAGRGVVALLPDYRTFKRHRTDPRASVADAFAAWNHVQRHAEVLGVDPQRIMASGASAGGHLAAALATLDPADFGEPPVARRPAALFLMNPVYDNGPDGYAHDRIDGDWRNFSPLANLSADVPPTLVAIGDRDHLIPLTTARRFDATLKNFGVDSRLMIFEGGEHGFCMRNRNPAGYRWTRNAGDDFLVELGWIEPANGNVGG